MTTSVTLISVVFSLAAALQGPSADDDFDADDLAEQEFRIRVVLRKVRGFDTASTIASMRHQFDSLVSQQIQEIVRICPLTTDQRQKLQLAGAGDSKRFLDRVEKISSQLELDSGNAVKMQELIQEQTQLNRRALNPNLSDENSLFVKSLKSTLSADEFARYQQLRAVGVAGGSVQTSQRGVEQMVDLTLSGTAIADHDLASLAKLSGLQSLVLNDTGITDAGLAHLRGLTSLAVLRLDNTRITDAGLRHLTGLAGLREISLDNTEVTDAGLAHLAGLVELQWLSLGSTQVTSGGLVHLKALKRLQFLDLAATHVADAGLPHLCRLTGLQSLNFEGTQVTSAGLKQFRGLTGLVELGFIDPPRQSVSAEVFRARELAADPRLGQTAGQVRDDNGLGIELVWCPGGFLKMANGAAPTDDEALMRIHAGALNKVENSAPVKVFLSHGYWLGKYEVTQGDWKKVMPTTPWNVQSNLAQAPEIAATYITWPQAVEFCDKLTENERKAGRLPEDWEYTLPTEAQWERACRAGTATQFSFGDDVSELAKYAWFQTNAQAANENFPHPVGQKKPNPWGLYDMHGNVREWCRDVFVVKLPGGRDPEVTAGGQNRVIRGGNYYLPASSCRSSSRDSSPPNGPISFRLALCPVRPGAARDPKTESAVHLNR